MKRLILVSSLAALTSFSAFAQDATPPSSDATKPGMTEPTPAPAPNTTMPAPSTSATTSASAKMTLSDDEAKQWIGKTVYSSDNSNLGEVSEFKRGTNNEISGLTADVGGFLGLGETKMDFQANQFSLKDDTVVLNLSKAEVQKMQSAVDAAK
jgi:PRC-barrel domain